MRSILGRAFTTREKVLLVILSIILLVCVYFLLVWQPTLNSKAEAEQRLSTIQNEIAMQQVMAAQTNEIEAEIQEAKSLGYKAKTLPTSDSTKGIIVELNRILSSANTFSIDFEGSKAESGIVRRGVIVSFTANSYADAENIIRGIMDCSYSCMVKDFAITNGGSSDRGSSVSATVAITFFEAQQGN